MLEGKQRTSKKLASAANKRTFRTRYIYNSSYKNSRQLYCENVESKNVHKRVRDDKASQVLYTSKVTSRKHGDRDNSSCTKQIKDAKVVQKAIISSVQPHMRQLNAVQSMNRFQPLSDIEEHEIDCLIGNNVTRSGQVNTSVLIENVATTNEMQSSPAEIKKDDIHQTHVDNVNTQTFDTSSTVAIVKYVAQAKKPTLLRKVNVCQIKDKVSDLKKCIEQQQNVMGFLPITNLRRLRLNASLKPNVICDKTNFDPIKVHEIVLKTGRHNFEQAKIQLPSAINFDLLEELSEGYWDYQLPYFLKFGFPLDFPKHEKDKLKNGEENHKSATQYPSHIHKYLATEISHGAIMGPYKQPPYGKTTHVSPFMSREKPNCEDRRIIIDLSWPEMASVNYFTPYNQYLGTTYKLEYPTIDHITRQLCILGKNASLYKVDLSRAFRQLPIDPSDYNLLCLKWGESYFSDLFCPFGHRSGSMACSRLSSFFRYVMRKQGFCIYPYVDDLMGIEVDHKVEDSFNYLVKILEELNFPISKAKLVSPTKTCVCLGVVVDIESTTLSVPIDKQNEILGKCKKVYNMKCITKKGLQSLLGSLMFIYKCVKPSRFFVNRLLEKLRNMTSNKTVVDQDIKQDVAWFLKFLPQFQGTASYCHVDIQGGETIEIDATLNSVGGVWGNEIYNAKIPDDILVEAKTNITHLEMINIIVALNIWGSQWRHGKVLIKTDNMATVNIYNKGYTRDSILAKYARNIWLLTAKFDISLKVIHVPGKINIIADLLSRWSNSVSDQARLRSFIPQARWCEVPQNAFHTCSDI